MASFVILLIAHTARIACADRHTYIHTYTRDNYCNPLCACAPRVNKGPTHYQGPVLLCQNPVKSKVVHWPLTCTLATHLYTGHSPVHWPLTGHSPFIPSRGQSSHLMVHTPRMLFMLNPYLNAVPFLICNVYIMCIIRLHTYILMQ